MPHAREPSGDDGGVPQASERVHTQVAPRNERTETMGRPESPEQTRAKPDSEDETRQMPPMSTETAEFIALDPVDDPVAEIASPSFPPAFRGYERSAVDAYVMRVTEIIA